MDIIIIIIIIIIIFWRKKVCIGGLTREEDTIN